MDASLPRRPATGAIEFRPLRSGDRASLLGIAEKIWEGDDYLPHVFDQWIADGVSYFPGIFLDGLLVGCGRLLPLDERCVWLEALRIDPAYQGRGLGREMAVHVIGAARQRGFQELLFSTYFDNISSIQISQEAGFRRIATFTNLELRDLGRAIVALGPVETHQIQVEHGVPDVEDFLVTDWFFLPPAVKERERFFPGAVTVADTASRLLLAKNIKYPKTLEICWHDGPAGGITTASLAYALDYAKQQGFQALHTMVPTSRPIEPFTRIGFSYFEQRKDVFLYTARVEDLSL